jgi:hypothetical protein
MPQPILWLAYLLLVIVCFIVALWMLRQLGVAI